MSNRARLSISLSHLEHNLIQCQKLSKHKEIICMLKANAYGHGDRALFNFYHHQMGLRDFGFASLEEALNLKNNFPSEKEHNFYVFSDINLKDVNTHEYYCDWGIIPVISNLENLKIFLESKELCKLPLVLKVNTGMNRLGINSDEKSLEEVFKLLKKHGRKSIQHLMSHFACASLSFKTNPHNKRQLENFKQIKNEFIANNISLENTSLSNSGAIEQGEGLDESFVRPGLMLYGASSLLPSLREQSLFTGKIASCLSAKVLQTSLVKKGDPCGYGAHPVHSDGLLVNVAMGYGDGFINHYSGLNVLHNQVVGKIVGRVSMDMLQVLFPKCSLDFIDTEEHLEFWNHSPRSIEEFCAHTKMIPYELFCLLSSRVERYYVS